MSATPAATRMLVIAPNWIGDALMALPLLAALKDQLPTRSLTALAPAAVAAVLRQAGLIDDVIEAPWPHGGLQLGARVSFAREHLRGRFDEAIVLPNSFKSALLPFFAGVPRRYGYVGEMRRGILNHSMRAEPALPTREHYLALGRLFGLQGATGTVLQPRLSVPTSQLEKVTQRFGIVPERPVIVFCPGAEYGPAKRWPSEHFAELANRLQQRDGDWQIVLAGAQGDVAAAQTIKSQVAANIISTVGATNVSEVIALLSRADFVVSNDSGLMHVAAALGRPLAALYGSTDPNHTPPQSHAAQIFWLHLSCSPCFARVCPLGHFKCLRDLSAETVLAAIPRVTVH